MKSIKLKRGLSDDNVNVHKLIPEQQCNMLKICSKPKKLLLISIIIDVENNKEISSVDDV